MLATRASMTNWNDVVVMGSRLRSSACPGMPTVVPALTRLSGASKSPETGETPSVRHGRACPDHPRLHSSSAVFKTWMLATRASMTIWINVVAMGSRLRPSACPGMPTVVPALTRLSGASKSPETGETPAARHGRACPDHPRLASLNGRRVQDMDARHKGEHDELERRRGRGFQAHSLPGSDDVGLAAPRLSGASRSRRVRDPEAQSMNTRCPSWSGLSRPSTSCFAERAPCSRHGCSPQGRA